MNYPSIQVIIVGSAGVGKTRIAKTVQDYLTNLGMESHIAYELPVRPSKTWFEINKVAVSIVTTMNKDIKLL